MQEYGNCVDNGVFTDADEDEDDEGDDASEEVGDRLGGMHICKRLQPRVVSTRQRLRASIGGLHLLSQQFSIARGAHHGLRQ